MTTTPSATLTEFDKTRAPRGEVRSRDALPAGVASGGAHRHCAAHRRCRASTTTPRASACCGRRRTAASTWRSCSASSSSSSRCARRCSSRPPKPGLAAPGGVPLVRLAAARSRSPSRCSTSRTSSTTSPSASAIRRTADVVMGTILVVLLLEATRRSMGWPLPIIAIDVHGLCAGRAVFPGPAQAFRRVVAVARQPPLPDEPGHLRHRDRRGRDLRLPLRAVRRARDARSASASSSSTSRRRSPVAMQAARRRCRCSPPRSSACSRARRWPTR